MQPVPVILYHSVLEPGEAVGRYVVSPAALEGDLRCLAERGCRAVVVRDLLAYVYSGVPLPEKPVVLTFDDGFRNNLRYALPLMRRYGMRMVLSPVGRDCDRAAASGRDAPFACADWSELGEAVQGGFVELQNHSYALHRRTEERCGARRAPGESLAQYREMLMQDLGRMQRRLRMHTGEEAAAFVYPFGAVSEESTAILQEMGFRAALTCEEKVNLIVPGKPERLYSLGRFLRTGEERTEEFFRRVFPQEE